MKSIISIDKINELTKDDFIDIFGNVFEKTNWIADQAYNLKPYKSFNQLSSIMIKIYEQRLSKIVSNNIIISTLNYTKDLI